MLLNQRQVAAAGRVRHTLRVVTGSAGTGPGECSASGQAQASGGAAASGMEAQEQGPGTGYMMPPPAMAAIVDAPPEPQLSFSPDRTTVMQLGRPPPNPSIEELARPELKLAGAQPGVRGAVKAPRCWRNETASGMAGRSPMGPVLRPFHPCHPPDPMRTFSPAQACGWTPRPFPAAAWATTRG